ncbi:YwiC-like family protein [Paenibacillus azoreducens]|uniref:Membrane protein n=1 Tax=Paenibacillus azoreducens TaxID=116718 RepID=A0A919YF99_9BACL|nr:YwiC-like family protein [Paenibacillus azoreducens]GIO48593.1 membrane protein [Paenibacillus azoreducens]
MKKTNVVIPREHGGWAMVVLPYVIGMMAVKPVLLHLPLFLAWLFLYLSSYPLLQSLKKTAKRKTWLSWGIGYAVFAFVCLVPVLLVKPWLLGFAPVLILLILINSWHVLQKKERALLNDVCAILLFCTGGAAAYMLGGGGFDARLAGVILFNFLYFMSTVFFVKSVFRERKNTRWTVYAKMVHMMIFILPLLCGYPWMCVPFFYPFAKTFLYAGKSLKPMRVGIMEIIGSVQFLLLTLMLF